MSRRRIKKIIQSPESYGEKPKQFPKVTLRPDGINRIHTVKKNIQKRSFTNKVNRSPLTHHIAPPIKFIEDDLPKTKKDICFVVGGGPSLDGFDFSLLNGFDTIAVNKSVEYIPNPTYFVTTDYSYFIKASLPIEKINQKVNKSYFIANMSHSYMEYKNGYVVDTRRNFKYEDLYHYDGIIESYNKIGFSSSLVDFSHGENSGHCGIQLALLLGYKKIYLLGFDLNKDGLTHFHQSYRKVDQDSFKKKVDNYADILLTSLAKYEGSQEIINLSPSSILCKSNHIKTESFNDVLKKQGSITASPTKIKNTLDDLMIVGYYTVNTPYEEEAKILLRSLNIGRSI